MELRLAWHDGSPVAGGGRACPTRTYLRPGGEYVVADSNGSRFFAALYCPLRGTGHRKSALDHSESGLGLRAYPARVALYHRCAFAGGRIGPDATEDRKSTRLYSSNECEVRMPYSD